MREISLHILDLVQNSLAAQAKNIWITVMENRFEDKMVIKIKDDGRGMSEEALDKVLDPFYTTRTTRKVGLGIPLLAANAQACEGNLEVKSVLGEGTSLEATFRLSHLDCPPLGDMPSTLIALFSASPEVNFFYEHKCEEKSFQISTREVKENLTGLSLQNPLVLGWLQDFFKIKEQELQK
ncbi:MAG TPA: sensor histidine kinase [Clostridia bacterium]|jgi:hypothetical protein|nr:ATP-binding protein [Clostridia bacterium]HHY06566.1 sensor histidine kinase [Clostridia bacterium]